MGLNPRGRGRGRGNTINLQGNGGHGGMMSQLPIFRSGPPGISFPAIGFPPQPPFGPPQFFRGTPRYHFGPPRHAYYKNNWKSCTRKFPFKSCESPVPEINLTHPWVTEEIVNEEKIKQELLGTWTNDKTDENWAKYKTQQQTVQTMYDKAKADYMENHPNEVVRWGSNSVVRHHFCETCDRAFKTEDDLLLHESEHETCGREGCDFTAHPKMIAKHIKMQHETGLYKRIGKLYTDEDVAKWIEERKKRYPTRKVVEEKKILEQEKLKRGEKLKESKSIFNKSFSNKNKNRGKKNFEKKANRNNRNRRTKKKAKVSLVLKSLEEETAVRKGVPAFSGINNNSESVASDRNDFDISDEEWKTESKTQRIQNPLLNSALGLLATCYDSDEENQKCQNESKVEDLSADDGSDPEEVSSKIPAPEENSKEHKFCRKRKFQEKKHNRERKRKNYSERDNFPKRNLTLLEKLLKNEIRHERNVILQCVHYVVNNNFFKT